VTPIGHHRRITLPAIGLLVLVMLIGGPPVPVFADPSPEGSATDAEGGSAALRQQLDAAARGYNDAQGRLDASKGRQAQLTAQMRDTEAQLARLGEEVSALAVTSYKGGRIGGLVALLDSGSPDGLLARARTLESLARQDDQLLRQLKATRATLAGQQAALDAEIKTQQDQLAEMDKRQQAAEKALAGAGGGARGTGFTADAPGATGAPAGPAPTAAPRRPDGTWARESCSVNDPTTSSCLTPRTLHALQQARAAGFTRYTACHTGGTWGEHPVGRACDFAAAADGFADAATGGDKAYGDRLAAWLITNADRLAVLYVIWYRQIWMPGIGWRTYRHGDGSPSGNHTNHVHLSVH
jgi:hypothetical protein